jgi:hypothetical protein
MTEVRSKGNYEQWIKFFLRAVAESAEDAIITVNKLHDLHEKNYKKLQSLGRAKANAIKLFEYVEQNIHKPFSYRTEYPITFFDFECEPWKNGISNCCVISKTELDEKLPKTFEFLKDNKYFNGAIGWRLGFDGEEWCHFRPQIELILPVELEIQFKNEQKKLTDDINRFYTDCRYCGD